MHAGRRSRSLGDVSFRKCVHDLEACLFPVARWDIFEQVGYGSCYVCSLWRRGVLERDMNERCPFSTATSRIVRGRQRASEEVKQSFQWEIVYEQHDGVKIHGVYALRTLRPPDA